MIDLWLHCRADDMGSGRLPDEGGVSDQSPFVLGCFDILERGVKEFGKGA